MPEIKEYLCGTCFKKVPDNWAIKTMGDEYICIHCLQNPISEGDDN